MRELSPLLTLLLIGLLCCGAGAQKPTGPYSWYAADRWAKVAELIPGRQIPKLTPDTLYAEWTAAQVKRWSESHPALSPDEAYRQFAAAKPTDAELTADFPRHIAPYGRLRSGQVDPALAAEVMLSYCPFCRSRTMGLAFDPGNPYHATTTCCRTELYGREQDFPAGYALKPNATVDFAHLDDTTVAVPCTVYCGQDGAEWELFIKTIFDHRRWIADGCDRVRDYGKQFEETADPLYAHKIAVILDQVADTYYGLPLAWHNEVCRGKDGQPLTRAEWEAVPRPCIFEVSYLGPQSRRTPLGSKGWINMFDEHIWVEPFGRVRHHPAFKHYSQVKYGDPEALDRKVMTKLLREVALMFKSVFSQKLLTNYQEANYVDMWLLGILLQDRDLLSFAGPAQEVTMYNHTFQDGLNGEGAPNYMAMPGGYFYPFLADPKGWLQYYPKFLEEHPFYHAANGEMRKLHTVRGMQVEYGDQHEHALPYVFELDPAKVASNEKLGSRNWAGYGVGILRFGGPGHRQEVCLDYTRATLHNAQDALSIGCWFDGVPVMRRGGYAAWWSNAPLQWQRPEYQALKTMGYPYEIDEGPRSFSSWTWIYAHSPLSQNGVIVDRTGTGTGWHDDRGYGEVLCFKGGEQAGEPGSGFQVLDVKDHYSFARVGIDVSDFRRTLLGVEGPDGRPYLLDLLKLTGGRRHDLFNSARADRAEANLPPVRATADNLALWLFDGKPPKEPPAREHYEQVRQVTEHQPGAGWDVTWRLDLAALAPRDPAGGAFKRPWPEDVGRVRMRLMGVNTAAEPTTLTSAKGPWIGWLRQPLPNGQRVDGNVAFRDARDFVVETRTGLEGQPLSSLFCHVIEGFREGERSLVRQVTRLAATSTAGGERDVVALKLDLAAGHSDQVVYQSDAGTVRLPDGVETDARYALIRRDAAGRVIAADAARGSFLKAGEFSVELPGEFTGELVDVIGDLTGTRRESALVIKPDRPWPVGADLHDRQLLIKVVSPRREPCNEGYRIDRVSALPDGLVRVDVQDHAPFVVSWHEVTVLPEDRPNVLRTWRPMVDHGNTPWYDGLKVAFPERGKVYPIQETSEVGGGVGGDTLVLDDGVNLAADGIKVGDWYVIYGIEPGLKVTVANDFSWRREPAAEWTQHALRATGPVTVTAPATGAALAWRAGDGQWVEAPAGKRSFTTEETGGRPVRLVSGAPQWLNLNDVTAPRVAAIRLDGRELTAEQAAELGWIEPPAKLVVELLDADSPLDPGSLKVTLNGERIEAAPDRVRTSPGADGKGLTVEVDLEHALAADQARPRKHRVEVAVADRSVERQSCAAVVTFINKVPLDPEAVYLSDLKPVASFAHGGLLRDRDYVGNPAEIRGRIYPKCLTLCPEPAAGGAHGEAVYELTAEQSRKTFLAEVGVSDSSRGNGSVVFQVQTGEAADGPWRTRFTSEVKRGAQDPVTVEVPLAGARFLRLYTTDAGDGIGSDHAVWGNARLR